MYLHNYFAKILWDEKQRDFEKRDRRGDFINRCTGKGSFLKKIISNHNEKTRG